MEAELAAGGSPARSAPPPKDKPLLFDLVFDEAQRPTAVPNSMISGRESKNPTQCSWERKYGQMRTSSMDFGYGIEQAPHGKPQFARMPVLEATVYRPCAIPNHAKHHRVHQATQVKREGDECGRSAAAAVAGAEGEASEIVAKRPKSVCAPRASIDSNRSRPTVGSGRIGLADDVRRE